MAQKVKNAIGYVRVSTQQQGGEDKYGIEAQQAAIRLYAEQNGYFIREWLIDEASGATIDRPQLTKLIGPTSENDTTKDPERVVASNPPYEAVIVYKNDRIARDTKIYFYVMLCLERKGIKLISIDETFPEGDFANIYRSLMMFVAEMERKNITIRTKAGRRIKANEGKWAGGLAPVGYRCIKGYGLRVVPEEAKMVRLIFRLVDMGYGPSYIADYLNDMGFTTSTGGKYSPARIVHIRNKRPVYEGMYKYGDMEHYIVGTHTPIIDTVYNPNDPKDHSKHRDLSMFTELPDIPELDSAKL